MSALACRAAAAVLLGVLCCCAAESSGGVASPTSVAVATPPSPAATASEPDTTPSPGRPGLAGQTTRDHGDHLVGENGPAARRVFAVLVNGGARREINYRSHLQHVRSAVDLLERNGVAADQITIFSADGDDPAPDLATREDAPERGSWLLPGNVAGSIGPQIDYVSSTVEGFTLRPARLDALRSWFADVGARLHAGDTLLFYVTDHGDKNESDPTNNTISLWGEALHVDELQDLLATLDPAVQVVLLMSQCYAGAFSRLMYRARDDALPSGGRCGFFSAPRDRPAYGCFPENRGKDGVGHSYLFLDALAELGRFAEAERRVLVTDDSPDVPHTTLDAFFEHVLDDAAHAAGKEPRAYEDELIATAWRRRAAFEPEIRLLDRIGEAFGSFSPRSLAELDEQARALPELSSRLKAYADRWRQALESLRIENFKRFTDAHPAWRTRLASPAMTALDADERRAMGHALLAELVPFTGDDPGRHARLLWLKRKADAAAAAHYRAEVRVAAVMRLRSVLLRVAGTVFVAGADAPTRRAADTLAGCEAFNLGATPPTLTAATLPAPRAFPPLAEEQRALDGLLPAYMGIEFHPLDDGKRTRLHMRRGAVRILRVYPDSPAARAGLETGDVIVGPPDAPFEEPNQVREWTMRRQIDVPAPLVVQRDAELRTVVLRPGPLPLELPKLPGPPKVGSAAPALELELFRGTTDLAAARERLLFFWATWCTICKAAVPEVLAYGEMRGVDVVAITDEEAETLQAFFRDRSAPFPTIVAMDPRRRTFEHYGVSGTPTFVLVDAHGIVRHQQTGYPAEGLRIEGWHWREDAEKLSAH